MYGVCQKSYHGKPEKEKTILSIGTGTLVYLWMFVT